MTGVQTCALPICFPVTIGCGTRTYEGKDFFTIIDFVGATNLFYDKAWDDDPLSVDIKTTNIENIEDDELNEDNQTDETKKEQNKKEEFLGDDELKQKQKRKKQKKIK